MNRTFAIGILVLLTSQGNAQNWDRHMRLQAISIDITVNDFKATTYLEMEFYNPGEKEIEGLYSFNLQPGQVITAFQLDLFGQYRDGSIEEKWKATNAYNTIVGKKIDPALLSMHSPGSFSLRIYPVPAKSSRKLTMTLQQLLPADSNALHYQLPLAVSEKIASVQINIQAPRQITSTEGALHLPALRKSTNGNKTYYSATNIPLSTISFSLPFKEVSHATMHAGRYQFAVHTLPNLSDLPANTNKRLTVLWDASASASAQDRNRSSEISFLKQYISYYDISEMTLIAFNHRELSRHTFVHPATSRKWVKTLEQTENSGATQLGSVDLSGVDTDITFIFSDGNNTWGRKKVKGLKGPVYAIHAAPDPNNALLEELTGISGGSIINLNTRKIQDAIKDLNAEEAWLMDITSASGKSIVEQSLPLRLNKPALLYGSMISNTDTLYLHFGNSSRKTKTKAIFLNASSAAEDISRIDMLTKFEKTIRSTDWETVLDFGIDEKVVTPHTAYLVLERVEDYARYKIAPPKELEEACRKINYVWQDTRPLRRQKRQADEFTILNNVMEAFNKRIREWDQQASPVSLEKQDYQKSIEPVLVPESGTTQLNALLGSAAGIQIQQNNALEEVVVTGYGTSNKRMLTTAVTVVRTEEIGSFQTIEQALQGRVAGLQITTSGTPGVMPFVNIRGVATINARNQPLWILDGFPVQGNINDVISVFDIETITVIKDASAAAIYGSRAAFGAIVVTSKKAKTRSYNWYYPQAYRLKDMEDEGYISMFASLPFAEKKTYYAENKDQYKGQTSFFLDMANLYYKAGMQNQAWDILMEAAETGRGSKPALTAIAYMLEDWKLFDEAILLYHELCIAYPESLQFYRNLAWVYYQNKQYQQAVDILYTALKKEVHNSNGIKAMLLTEMNAIIAAHTEQVNTAHIPQPIIFNMPVDYRLMVDSNDEYLGSVYIKEPGKEKTDYRNQTSKNGGRYILHFPNQWHQPYAEYQQKQFTPGKYRLGMNYYSYLNKSAPAYARMMTFTNFGKKGQSLNINYVSMDNQQGEVEIADWRW